jgi:hypothetical protein
MEQKIFCPFCGREIEILLCDHEGNSRDQQYLDEGGWSGIGYYLSHYIAETSDEQGNDVIICPLQTHEEEWIGNVIYDSKEEAIALWNKRV